MTIYDGIVNRNTRILDIDDELKDTEILVRIVQSLEGNISYKGLNIVILRHNQIRLDIKK